MVSGVNRYDISSKPAIAFFALLFVILVLVTVWYSISPKTREMFVNSNRLNNSVMDFELNNSVINFDSKYEESAKMYQLELRYNELVECREAKFDWWGFSKQKTGLFDPSCESPIHTTLNLTDSFNGNVIKRFSVVIEIYRYKEYTVYYFGSFYLESKRHVFNKTLVEPAVCHHHEEGQSRILPEATVVHQIVDIARNAVYECDVYLNSPIIDKVFELFVGDKVEKSCYELFKLYLL